MRGPLRHLWVARGPQRQLLETIDVAATGFVLPMRSGRTMRSVVFLETPNCFAIALLRMLCPKGLHDSGLLRRQLSFAATESPPGSRSRQSRHCAFAEKNGVERLGRLVRRRTGRQADRHRALRRPRSPEDHPISSAVEFKRAFACCYLIGTISVRSFLSLSLRMTNAENG
jgi:hypothetical protein